MESGDNMSGADEAKCRDQICDLLKKNPNIKAKDIAKALDADKKFINHILYIFSGNFTKNTDHEWSLYGTHSIVLEFDGDKWIDCDSFENALNGVGCLLSSESNEVIFVFPRGCKFLLEAAARLLALTNQLAFQGKSVKIDFRNCSDSLRFFNRIGFIDRLNDSVVVLPSRPKISAAKVYVGNSDTVLEFGEIDPLSPNHDIPILLKNKFVLHAGEKYDTAIFTIFSELFRNVCEHSETPISGFAALQLYNYPTPHLQAVVSDSGKGIIGTLRPVLEKYYGEVFKRMDFSDPETEIQLLQEVLQKGRLTQTGEKGRGLGLSRSQEYALRYSATISVRQETFELKLFYRNNEFTRSASKMSMPKILGTHVCFDFILD